MTPVYNMEDSRIQLSSPSFKIETTESRPLHPHLQRDETAEILLQHIRVNAIADYYDIPRLAKLATSSIESILQNSWLTDSFPRVVQEVLSLTGDATLHAAITSTAVNHIEELVESQSFADMFNTIPFAVQSAAVGTGYRLS